MMPAPEGRDGASFSGTGIWLLGATFLIAVAGLVYELIAATASSYLIGDSVTQFSLVIGVFLSAMGLGAWVSRYVVDPEKGFVGAQIALGLFGGLSAPALFSAYVYLDALQPVMFGVLIIVGALVGAEIPLIARILATTGARHRFENVLTVDYVGALVASLLFPLLIVPHLGLMSASLAFGLLNIAVALISIWLLGGAGMRRLGIAAGFVGVICAIGLVLVEDIVSALDANLYEDDIILIEETAYQKIVVTRFGDRTRLFLNNSIQFDSLDEHRYHEALVHPAMGLAPAQARVLILGGGDGMAAREVLRHQRVDQVVLVDLDPRVTDLFASRDDLAALNGGSLRDPRLSVVNLDAWVFARDDARAFDVVIADLPDPHSLALSKLYSIEFYAMLMERLAPAGVFVTQAGSPVFAREAFWSVAATLGAARSPAGPGRKLRVTPYHIYTPSFGDWGFVLARAGGAEAPTLPDGLKFLTPDVWAGAQSFGRDADRVAVEVNSIRDHALVRYYNAGWDRWFR